MKRPNRNSLSGAELMSYNVTLESAPGSLLMEYRESPQGSTDNGHLRRLYGFVLERLSGVDNVRCRKTFGEYMVYVEDKPIFTVCDNTVFVKKLPEAAELMKDCSLSFLMTVPRSTLFST